MDVDVPLLPSPECTVARIDTVVEANPITRHTVDKALPFHNVGDGSAGTAIQRTRSMTVALAGTFLDPR